MIGHNISSGQSLFRLQFSRLPVERFAPCKMKRTTTLFDFAFQSNKKKKEEDKNDEDCATPQDEAAASSSSASVSKQSEDSRDSADRGEEGGASISTRSGPTSSPVSTETESRTQAQPTSADSSRSKKRVKAQDLWLKKWSWLKLTGDGGMQCELCLKHSKKNHIDSQVRMYEFSYVNSTHVNVGTF